MRMLDKMLRRVRGKPAATRNVPFEYACGGASILLTPDHMLPVYQAEHRLYDRFLPIAAKCLEPDTVVVDVGANCGDTLASMVAANPLLRFACIEPDDRFFALLTENRKRIAVVYPETQITLIKSLVGLTVKSAVLSGTGGTRGAKPLDPLNKTQAAPDVQQSATLDALLEHSDLRSKRVRLLKSDVDGYDFDVLDSAASTIATHTPLVFFECQYDNDAQRAGFSSTLRSFVQRQYANFWLFDNFGNPLLGTRDLATVEQVLDYVSRENRKKSTRTFYYVDILMCHDRDAELARRMVDEFIQTVIET